MSRVSPICIGALALTASCARPECAQPHFDRPECRVAAEAEFARFTTADGVQLAFLDPRPESGDTPAASGLLLPDEDGGVRGRPASLGGFRIAIDAPEAATLRLTLENVDPRIDPLPGEVERVGLQRELSLDLDPGRTDLVAALPDAVCEGPVRIAAAGDVQDNPVQLRRVMAALHDEAASADAAGEPLLGLLLLGDLSEHAREAELGEVLRTVSTSPVPVAATPGNHDVYDSQDAVYNRIFGPGNHAFTTCGVRVAMLDTGSGFLADSVRGRLPELLDVTDADHLIAAMHHPPDPGASSAGWSDEAQARHLIGELAARGADFALAGHVHRRMEIDRGDLPVLVAGTLGADQAAVDPDYGFLRLTFTGRRADACFVSLPAPGSPGVDRFAPANCRR